MQRLEVISKFCLALVSSVFLFISGVSLPPLGVILLPFVSQPVLMFGLKYGIGAGFGVIFVALVLLVFVATEELAFIYGIFALMAGLLLALLGRIRAIENLVVGVAAALLTMTARFMERHVWRFSRHLDATARIRDARTRANGLIAR